MLKSSLGDYSDAYMLVKETIIAVEETAAAPNNAKKDNISEVGTIY